MAIVQNIKAKVLIQVGEMEPVQIGEVDIPIDLAVSEPKKNHYRGGVVPNAHTLDGPIIAKGVVDPEIMARVTRFSRSLPPNL